MINPLLERFSLNNLQDKLVLQLNLICYVGIKDLIYFGLNDIHFEISTLIFCLGYFRLANDHLVISDSYPGENLVSCQELKLDDLLFPENIHSHQLSRSGEFNSGSSILSIFTYSLLH